MQPEAPHLSRSSSMIAWNGFRRAHQQRLKRKKSRICSSRKASLIFRLELPILFGSACNCEQSNRNSATGFLEMFNRGAQKISSFDAGIYPTQGEIVDFDPIDFIFYKMRYAVANLRREDIIHGKSSSVWHKSSLTQRGRIRLAIVSLINFHFPQTIPSICERDTVITILIVLHEKTTHFRVVIRIHSRKKMVFRVI